MIRLELSGTGNVGGEPCLHRAEPRFDAGMDENMQPHHLVEAFGEARWVAPRKIAQRWTADTVHDEAPASVIISGFMHARRGQAMPFDDRQDRSFGEGVGLGLLGSVKF
jgi:hypothetical protein